MCATTIRELVTIIFSKRICVLKKAFLQSSCSTVVTKKFKRIHGEEFSEIAVLEPATLPNNELLHSHFSNFLITNVEWYYNGIVTLSEDFTNCLRGMARIY